MGNCLLGAGGESDNAVIKVIRSDGGVLEFNPPMTVGCITAELPGHVIFSSNDDYCLLWPKPLCPNEALLPGHSYYLLPDTIDDKTVRNGHVRSKTCIPATSSSHVTTPYRMSHSDPIVLKRSFTDVLWRDRKGTGRSNGGFWKVKLVIKPGQLVEMLSEDGKTGELIESVRAVARCGNGAFSSSSSSSSLANFSDRWSLSSSRNASSKKDLLLVDI